MKRRKTTRTGPVALSGPRSAGRRTRSVREEILEKDGLETPLPGHLLMLLSRLYRSERSDPASGGRAGDMLRLDQDLTPGGSPPSS